MATALATGLQKAMLTLWGQLDVEKGCLPSGSCRRLLEELKELQEITVPAGYALSSRPLSEAIDILQAINSSSTASLPISDAPALSSLLAQAVALFAAPLPPSTAYDPSRPTLPSEIISIILHELGAEQYTALDVAACCLVSKSFLPLAREALYHTLYLRVYDQERDAEGKPLDLPSSAKRGSDLAISYGQLSSSLPRHPHLASLVRRMELTLANSDDIMDHVNALHPVSVLLDACRPQHVTFSNGAGAESSHFARMLWQSRQRFRGLRLGSFAEDEDRPGAVDPELWQLLQEQDTLQYLSLDFDASISLPSRLPVTLKELHIEGYSPTGADPIEALLHHSARTLTHLSFPLDISASTFATPQLSNFPNLLYLSVMCRSSILENETMGSLEKGRCRALFASLPPSVQSITLAGPTHLDLAPVIPLEHLPSTLVSLDIRSIHFSSATLLAFLRAPSSVHLRRLRYSTSDGRGHQPASRSSWSEAEVCARLEARGIKAY